MLSHLSPMDGYRRWGELRQYLRAPLAERPWASVGGTSGAVYVHLCEQGRPQGASFSAGDLSRHAVDAALSTASSSFPSFEYPALEANSIDRMDGVGQPPRYVGPILETAAEAGEFVSPARSPCPSITEGRIILPPNLRRTAAHRRQRGVCRGRQTLSALGARHGLPNTRRHLRDRLCQHGTRMPTSQSLRRNGV